MRRRLLKPSPPAIGAGATLNGAPIAASTRRELEGARIAGPRAADRKASPTRRPRSCSASRKFPRSPTGWRGSPAGSLDGAFASADSHDWDIAAADIILGEAGARLSDADGRPLDYNRRGDSPWRAGGRAARAAAPAGRGAAPRLRRREGRKLDGMKLESAALRAEICGIRLARGKARRRPPVASAGAIARNDVMTEHDASAPRIETAPASGVRRRADESRQLPVSRSRQRSTSSGFFPITTAPNAPGGPRRRRRSTARKRAISSFICIAFSSPTGLRRKLA